MSKRLICCCNDLLNDTLTRRFRIALPWLVLSLILLFQAITPAVAISQTPAGPSALTISGGTNPSPPPTGNTYYVATNGSDGNSCSTAQNSNTPKRNIMGTKGGISCLAAGDTLDIRAGTYSEQINSYSTPTLPNGTSGAHVTIRGHAGETVTIGYGIGFHLNAGYHYWDFSHLVVKNPGANNDGIHVARGNDHFTFTDMEVTGTGWNGISGGCGFCTYSYIWVHETHQDVAGYGLYVWTNNSIFEHMEIGPNPGYGIHMYDDGATDVSNNVIRYNKIHNNGGFGSPGHSDLSQMGIYVSHGTNNQVYGNLVYDNQNGIDISASCTSCLVYNNTVFRNTTGYPGGAIDSNKGIRTGSGGTIARNNIVYLNPVNGIDNPSGTSVVSNNHCDSAASGCATTGDPLFVDVTKSNFAVKAGSPVIDRGTVGGIPPYDIEGIFRPRGLGWDIGAYESW